MVKKLTCLECKKDIANTPNVLSRHVRTVHQLEWPDYVVKHEHKGAWPLCVCGCGEKLAWKKGGFGKYIRGHDVKQAVIQAGWLNNPFTGREEYVPLDDDVMLMRHCVNVKDPVTHEHGINVSWEDGAGNVKFIQPSFKHLQKKLLLFIMDTIDPEFKRKSVGIKQWCESYGYSYLALKRNGVIFDVVGGYVNDAGVSYNDGMSKKTKIT